MQDQKYICNKCGFDSLEGGYCPMCEEGYMLKVCECGTGKYAFECCEVDPEQQKREELAKLEAEGQIAAEKVEEVKKEEMKEEAEEMFLEEASKESPKDD